MMGEAVNIAAPSPASDKHVSLVAALEAFMRRVPGSGPYTLDIRDKVDAMYGEGAFMRGIGAP